jgi:hypothetical protein
VELHALQRLGNAPRRELLVDDDDPRQEGQMCLLRENLLHLLRVLRKSHGAVGVLEDVAGFVRHGVRAPRNIGRPDAEDSQVGDDPFLPVVRDDPDVVTSLHAEIEQTGPEALEQGRELLVGNLLPFARLGLAHERDLLGVPFRNRPEALYDRVLPVLHHVLPYRFVGGPITYSTSERTIGEYTGQEFISGHEYLCRSRPAGTGCYRSVNP